MVKNIGFSAIDGAVRGGMILPIAGGPLLWPDYPADP